MAFLDNSGDIILDAVLTDTGRFRMARGDFRISKFALADDEIDYTLYNKNHPSGSAYYDLEVLRTPVLEAFTNNTSTMKSKLLSITQTNLLYLPVLKLMDGGNAGNTASEGGFFSNVKNSSLHPDTGGYIITTTADTEIKSDTNQLGALDDFEISTANHSNNGKGIIAGSDRQRLQNADIFIALERGLDTAEISPLVRMPASLQETQFIIEADYRLSALTDVRGNRIDPSFIDDDQIASYYVNFDGTDGSGVSIVLPQADNLRTTNANAGENLSVHNIRGPRDRTLQFKLEPSINLTTSDFLFDKLGNSDIDGSTMQGFKSGAKFKTIDTLVRVTSATTAFSIDVPIRFIKVTTSIAS